MAHEQHFSLATSAAVSNITRMLISYFATNTYLKEANKSAERKLP